MSESMKEPSNKERRYFLIQSTAAVGTVGRGEEVGGRGLARRTGRAAELCAGRSGRGLKWGVTGSVEELRSLRLGAVNAAIFAPVPLDLALLCMLRHLRADRCGGRDGEGRW